MGFKDKNKKIAYNNQWNAENRERITLLVKTGEKAKIVAHAESRGYSSLNAYIVNLIKEDMNK